MRSDIPPEGEGNTVWVSDPESFLAHASDRWNYRWDQAAFTAYCGVEFTGAYTAQALGKPRCSVCKEIDEGEEDE